MMRSILAVVFCMLTACGMDNAGKEGPMGPVGPEGPAGQPGRDAVLKTTLCQLDWDFGSGRGQNLELTVIHYLGGAVGSSLVRLYYADDYEFRQTSSVLKASGESTLVGDAVMTAELISEKRARFTRKAPLETREVDCEVK